MEIQVLGHLIPKKILEVPLPLLPLNLYLSIYLSILLSLSLFLFLSACATCVDGQRAKDYVSDPNLMKYEKYVLIRNLIRPFFNFWFLIAVHPKKSNQKVKNSVSQKRT